uniref:Putative Zinc/iron permease n=1 Tax=Moniliophthora roreri TaxID=221103 RepID=A0A0W0F8B7_MONRR
MARRYGYDSRTTVTVATQEDEVVDSLVLLDDSPTVFKRPAIQSYIIGRIQDGSFCEDVPLAHIMGTYSDFSSTSSPIRDSGTMKEALDERLSTMGIIFAISLFAVSFPAISKRSSFLPIPKIVFFIGKHFGTGKSILSTGSIETHKYRNAGVILSTAFVHLLKDSFQALTDPLVESRYPRVGDQTGLIILGSLLLIFLIEYVSTSYVDHLHRHQEHSHDEHESHHSSRNSSRAPSANLLDDQTAVVVFPEHIPTTNTTEATPLLTSSPISRYSQSRDSQHHSHDVPIRPSQMQKPHYLASIVTNNPRHSRSSEYFYIINDINHHISNGEYHLVGGKNTCVCVCVCPASGGHTQESSRHSKVASHGTQIERHDDESDGNHEHPPELSRKRQIVGILVLQMGIMIHSLVIGLTLAIASGAEFTTLTTAIIFHQLFEGLSLGIRIASIPPPASDSLPLHRSKRSRSPSQSHSVFGFIRGFISGHDGESSKSRWLQPVLSLLFAITTPIGITLGILVFSSNGRRSEVARMMLIQGLMSAISAGMLIYAATVEMLAADFVFGNVGSSGGEHGHSHGEEFMQEESEDNNDQNTWKKKVLALVSLCAGIAGMGLIGLRE